MLQAFTLLLPALIPSWRFFKDVAPSPRIEAWDGTEWEPVLVRPARVSLMAMVARMVWNPAWNETLYMVSLSERLIARPTDHARAEMARLVAAHMGGPRPYRLLVVYREGAAHVREVVFESEQDRS
ncbi:hypothetical protein ACS3SW_18595 [Roseobacteraceae bacterium S113]